MYQRQSKWEFRYIVIKSGEQTEKVCYPTSKEQIAKNKDACRNRGYKFLSCKKLYPVSFEKHGHDLELVKNRCYILMCEMERGDAPYNEEEYDRLEKLRDRAEELLEKCYDRVSWLVWEDVRDFNRISELAIQYRMDKCIERGRYDLLQYC